MGELHLDILVDRLFREFNIDVAVSQPQIAYKETIRRPVKAEGKFVRQSGDGGNMAMSGCSSSPWSAAGASNSSMPWWAV
jgi:elongation factor G